MANDKPLPPAPKDSAWLQAQLVALLEDAMEASPKDHGACAKYADLLWKMLPKSTGKEVRARSIQDLLRQEQD